MANLQRNVAISLLFTLFGGPGIVLLLAPWSITRFRIPIGQPGWQIILAILLIALGLIPLLESIIRFIVVGHGTPAPTAPPEHLVITGLYRRVRNPMYDGALTVIAGEALLLWSRGMAIYLTAAWLTMHLFVCFYEEPKLRRTFPEEYPLYEKNVPRWLPRLAAWNARHSGRSN